MPNEAEWLSLARSLMSRATGRRELPAMWKRRLQAAIRDAGGDPDLALKPLLAFVRRDDVARRAVSARDAWQALAPKAVAGAHAALTGDWSRVAPHERVEWWKAVSFLRSHMGSSERILALPPAAPSASFARGDAGTPVPFAFPWTPAAASKGIGLSNGHVTVARLDGADAPVACRLHVPHGPAGRRLPPLPVRRHGDGWLRPVLAPGAWEAMDLDAFASASAGGWAWADNPFVRHAPDGPGLVGPVDYGTPVKPSPADGPRLRAAFEACVADAGPLHEVDGIVYRTCPAPMLTLFSAGAEARATWTLGTLRGTASMDTVMGAANRHGPLFPAPEAFEGKVIATFPLSEAGLVDGLATRAVNDREALLEAGPVPHVLAWADHALLPVDAVAPLRALLASLERGREAGRMGRPGLMGVLHDLVRAADLGYLDEAAHRALLDAARQDMAGNRLTTVQALLLRACASRSGDLAATLSAEDELSAFVP